MLNFHAPSAKDYECDPSDFCTARLTRRGLHLPEHVFPLECYYGEVGLAEGFVTQHLTQDGFEIYLYPAGEGDVRPALEAIFADAKERGGKLRLRGVTQDRREELERLLPGQISPSRPTAICLTISIPSRS